MKLVQGLMIVAALSLAQPMRADERADYLKDIKPVLKARCYACHGALKQEAGLRLDTGASIRKGSENNPIITPGQPKQSVLLERISEPDASLRMPPEGEPLSADQIAKIRAWILEGATSPKNEPPEQDPRDHWAFQKLVRPRIPDVDSATQAANPIDRFLDAVHQLHGHSPQPPAAKAVLLRRVFLDLIGLPPTREELQEFLADSSPEAYERVVDRLLNSPRYGERWGRHWMDVWRYSDWYGRRHVPDVWNSASQIWRWRDWIVSSLNEDQGYDLMVQSMLAGDEIFPADSEAGHATGYLIRNWYALNPNDWMRSNVEHTGKSFLGLTFNCAHCHDHKYDPITHEDYFRFRAFFEPIGIRQDRVPGEADPGPFQEYNYSTLRKVQRLGAVRIYDKTPEATTWFYTGGDERNRVKDRGSIPPGLPAFLGESLPKIEPIDLPPEAWYPGLRPGIKDTLLAEARVSLISASQANAEAKKKLVDSQAALERLKLAEVAYDEALNQAKAAGQSGALEGKQSLLLEASAGRALVQNRLRNLKALDDGSTLEFQFLILKPAHFNFQLAKDHTKGLTAGYVGLDGGKIISYRPGTFAEFQVGQFDFQAGQVRFQVVLKIETSADQCRLTVRSLSDQKTLVDNVPVALNGWNPVGDPTKAISFDARTGSVVVIDEIVLRPPAAKEAKTDALPEPLVKFDFEPPLYADGQSVIGQDGWISSSYSLPPATSKCSSTAANASLLAEWEKVASARRAFERETLPIRVPEARLAAAQAEYESLEARIEVEEARYQSPMKNERTVKSLMQKASGQEREAKLKTAEAEVLAQELYLANAEAKPEADAGRAKEIQAVTQKLSTARTALAKAREALADPSLAETYTPLGQMFPKTSTGRRRALALWITRRDNPLTARVAVNHIWMRHFHQPLVASVFDFGRNGAKPAHPDLLDWLAVELMDSDWSMKHLHRLIVTSAAYQRSSSSKGASEWLAIDPENHLLWHMNSGRMEAEVIRDSLLGCAGVLNTAMGGQELENDVALTTYRRSLYYSVHPENGGRNAIGELFDAPNPLECYRRTRSIIPQQALALTNSDLVHQMSASIAQEFSEEEDSETFLTAIFEKILSRQPTEEELAVCLNAFDEHCQLLKESNPDQKAIRQKARESLVRVLFNHNDFLTIR